MARHWEDRNYLINSIGPGGSWGHALWFLTILFAIIGIISDLANTALGLTSMAWFLLANYMWYTEHTVLHWCGFGVVSKFY